MGAQEKRKPRIIVFDLETIWDADEWLREDRAFAMGNWPGRTMKADINSIISFGYQELGKKAKCVSVWDFKHYTSDLVNDDYELCRFISDLFNDGVDAIITHNGRRFDFKFLQTRLKKHGLPPLPKHLKSKFHIDTCAVVKKEYSLFSNRLKDLTQFLGVSAKISTGGRKLWTRIYRGDKEAQREMAEYCTQDVQATGECALAMQDIIPNWPNFNIYNGTLNCCSNPNCGSTNIQKHGTRPTKTKLQQRYMCMDCGTTHSIPQGKIARSET